MWLIRLPLLFSGSVMYNSLWPHGLQLARLLSFAISQSLLKLVSIESMIPSNYLILSHLFPLLSSIFPRIRVFSSKLALLISGPSIGASGSDKSFQWIFRVDFLWVDWFDLLVNQGTLKSLLQHHNSKLSILRHSAIFMVQLSHQYMTTGKTITLPIQIFVGK